VSSGLTYAEAVEWAELRNAAVMRTGSLADGLGAFWDLIDLEIGTDAYQHVLFEMGTSHDGTQHISLARQFFVGGEPFSLGFYWEVGSSDKQRTVDDVCIYGARPGESCDVRGSLDWTTFRAEIERRFNKAQGEGWMLTGNFMI
jgi:hypothetical protein